MNSYNRILSTPPLHIQSESIRVAYLSSYAPRECGIATFCEDLISGVGASTEEAGGPIVVAMENEKFRHTYTYPVALTVDENNLSQYAAAAELMNDSPATIVCLQHEFGIYGGVASPALHFFLRRMKKPLVSILHTVTPNPVEQRRKSIDELAWHSDKVVVMNDIASDILVRDYGIDPLKIQMIHHGAPHVPRDTREETKARFGLAGKHILSTFGLISRGKGIDTFLEALPSIVSRHPDVVYLLIGKTHPGVTLYEKESYRDELRRRVGEMHLEEHVRFVNHYLTQAEIIDYLAATDIYVTPYLDPEQITSGTLAYAMAAGKAIVSTPYLYAQFLLNEGRGILVDFHDSQGLGGAINRLLDNPHLRQKMENLNYTYGQTMLWPRVGQEYVRLFRQVLREHETQSPVAIPLKVSYTAVHMEDDLHGYV